MWLVYSMSKEDVWVSRVPLPVKPDETSSQISGFENWNTYLPKWTEVAVSGDTLRMVDKDPYDYARATRVFKEARHVVTSFEFKSDPTRHDTLEVELLSKFGGARPVRILVPSTGNWTAIKIEADCDRKHATFTFGDQTKELDFADPADMLERISFRTGPYRNLGGPKPVPAGTDKPTEPVTFELRKFALSAS
jgi:hypothetical protein